MINGEDRMIFNNKRMKIFFKIIILNEIFFYLKKFSFFLYFKSQKIYYFHRFFKLLKLTNFIIKL